MRINAIQSDEHILPINSFYSSLRGIRCSLFQCEMDGVANLCFHDEKNNLSPAPRQYFSLSKTLVTFLPNFIKIAIPI